MERFFASIRKPKQQEDLGDDSVSFLIAGLGNPGREYRESRHNFGFMVADQLAERIGVSFNKAQLKGLSASGKIETHRVILLKPQTFMNLSGQSVVSFLNYYKIPKERLLVIHDDMDIPFGTLRMRPSGGNGGQKGLGSVIELLGTQQFARLRCGIGHPGGQQDVKDYVLNKFSKAESEMLPDVICSAADAAEAFVTIGLEKAMTKFNGSVEHDAV